MPILHDSVIEISDNKIFDKSALPTTRLIKSNVKPGSYLGHLRILYVFKSGTFLVIGPHWIFSLLMGIIHLAAGSGILIAFSAVGFTYYWYLGILIINSCCILFCTTCVTQPGIVFQDDEAYEKLQQPGETEVQTNVGKPQLKQEELVTRDNKHSLTWNQVDQRQIPGFRHNSNAEGRLGDNHDEYTDDNCDDNDSCYDSDKGDRQRLNVNSTNRSLRTRRMRHRWCTECNLIRPTGADHCDECGVCIKQLDHHCPWTSKCIGEANSVWFYLWLTSIAAVMAYFGVAASLLARSIPIPDTPD